jgi:hypothetical protein
MKIAVVGAGALGCTYAVRLSRVAEVTLVVRDLSRAPRHISLQRVGGALDELDAPKTSLEVPGDVDAIFVTVRVEQLGDELLDRLARGGDAPVVILTPLLPPHYARARTRLGDRLVVGMPGVVAYEPDPKEGERRIRYWTPSVSPTALDDRPPRDPRRARLLALRETLVSAGFPCEVARNVKTTNPATTIAFFPILLALQAAGGSFTQLIGDHALLKLALEAGREARALSRTVGELARFSSIFLSFASPFTVRAGIKLAKSRAPESIVFLEKHFGTKLEPQHQAMLSMILELAQERGTPVDALRRLARAAGLAM